MSLMAEMPSDSSNSMWTALEDRIKTTDPLARSLAFSELRLMKLAHDRPIKEQIAELCKLRSAYINAGGKLTVEEWHTIILKSLTGGWSSFAAHGNSITDPEKAN